MSTRTTNLDLVKPDLSDDVHTTISNLAKNMQKIDDASEVFVSDIPISGYFDYNVKRWNSQATIGEYVGWVNVRAGETAPLWQAKKTYNIGDKVVDSSNNSHYYTCTINGTSSVFEPSFPLTINSTVKDIKSAVTWSSNTYYEVDDIVLPTNSNGYFYVCIDEGNAGTIEPTWRTTDGQTFSDGDVTWIAHKTITWKESGTSANFRGFGKIE